MTFIKPEKRITMLGGVITMLVVVTVLGTFWLIGLYNGIVNLNHAIASAKTQLDAIGAQNTMLNNEIVATLGSGEVAQVAEANNLVEDRTPQYLAAQ